MAEDLSGKCALVTAASEELGFAIASRIAEAGATLAICARREPELIRSAEAITSCTGRRVVPLVADLAQATDVQRLTTDVLSALNAIDILVVNSGHIPYGGIDTLSDDDWSLSIRFVGYECGSTGAGGHSIHARTGRRRYRLCWLVKCAQSTTPPFAFLGHAPRCGRAGQDPRAVTGAREYSSECCRARIF